MNKRTFAILLICALFLLGIFILDITTPEEKVPKILTDNQSIYADDRVDSVIAVYITVMPADKASKKYQYTFKEINKDVNSKDDKQVKVIFQEGKNGPPKQGDYGFGLTDGNGVMQLRGQSSRMAEQKSYKIELNKKAGLWYGLSVINLNKHPFDSIRIRNKLALDYLKIVPNFVSLRTQFIHAYIKDYSEENYDNDFVDYGLFTNVENMDDDFLKNHGLDEKGALYKVENFEFFRYPDVLKLKRDENYNKDGFEEILEIKGNDDHAKLIQMLDDVNNSFKPINEVISEHFDRKNYVTWLAVNLLFGNVDTNSRNYSLYSPRDSKTWYFIPWDYDKSWGAYKNEALWQKGISNYWGNVLHRRFLQNKDNVAEVSRKIDELFKIFTEENTSKLVNSYKPIAISFLKKYPDNQYNKQTLEQIEQEFALLL